jgi:Iap family predicted aminopeptidase
MTASRQAILLPIPLAVALLLTPRLLTRAWAQSADNNRDTQTLLGDNSRSAALEENLQTICDELGGRLSGTPSMRRAVNWATEAFRQAGVDEVHTEPFEIPNSWREGESKIEVTAPVRFPVRGVSSAWVPATRGALRAEVLDGGSGTTGAIRRMGSAVRGKILLIHSDTVTTFTGLANEQRDSTIALREAAQAGAAAVLFMSTRPGGLLYRHVNIVDGRLDQLPTALIAREDAQRILRLIRRGKKIRMRLSLPNKTAGPFQARNVVAEIRGSEHPEEVVIIGAHLDSWDLGTGCLDNGVNVALVIEVARRFAKLERRPKRTVRFILFGGEELGLLGSKAYLRRRRHP